MWPFIFLDELERRTDITLGDEIIDYTSVAYANYVGSANREKEHSHKITYDDAICFVIGELDGLPERFPEIGRTGLPLEVQYLAGAVGMVNSGEHQIHEVADALNLASKTLERHLR